jgi:uncharacterized protein YjbJ (UPF0337 family)
MNWDQIRANWRQVKGKAQEKWGKLTDDDLDIIEGKREELIAKLQERYGRSREVTQREVDKWTHSLNHE